jgi:Zn-finger nucleic acid-binding protein
MPSCPVCKESMKEEKHGDVTIDVCDEHGIWLDQKELFQVTENERHAQGEFVWADVFRSKISPPVDHDRDLCCPACDKKMTLEKVEAVTIDWCREHGVWLDNGELKAINNNLRLDPTYFRGVALRLRELCY